MAQLGRTAEPFEARLQAAYAEGGEEAVVAEIERGEAEVLRTVYRGSPDALAEGVAEIDRAVAIYERLLGAPPGAVREQINGSGMLAEPRAHMLARNVARALLRKFGSA